MLDNPLTDKEEIKATAVVLPMGTENTIDRTCGQQGSFKENRTYNELILTIKKTKIKCLGYLMRK